MTDITREPCAISYPEGNDRDIVVRRTYADGTVVDVIRQWERMPQGSPRPYYFASDGRIDGPAMPLIPMALSELQAMRRVGEVS